jgi:hypothetical protein
MQTVEALADSVERMHVDAFAEARLVADQALQPAVQGVRQRVRERRQQRASLGMGPRQIHGTVEGHDGLAGARRARNPSRPAVVTLDPLPLFRV